VTDARRRQAATIHAIGSDFLACLLTELAEGGENDAEGFIAAFVDTAENLIRLALVPPGGEA
jgi:hypothetical protein